MTIAGPIKTHCHNCGVPWTEENVYFNHYHSPACKNCRKIGWQRWEASRKLGLERAATQHAKPKLFDHSLCDPRNVDSLCGECAEIFSESRKAARA
jgi:hypothetical protein